MAPPSKKRKLKQQSKTEEVVFDPTARFDYLTGFHKRKLERAKKAQEAAALKARQEKIDDRKKLREERKADLEAHVKAVNAVMPVQRVANDAEDDSEEEDGGDGWEGIPDVVPQPIDHEEEYIDEDKYTTVTVEEVDISRDGIKKLQEINEDAAEVREIPKEEVPTTKPKRDPSKKLRDKDKKSKKKKRNFKYESPADRKVNRLKDRAKRSKAAKARRGE